MKRLDKGRPDWMDSGNEFHAQVTLKSFATASLIAELEKRRPQCHYSTCKNMGSEVCGGCLWNTCMGDKLTDNFKPAK